MFGRCDNIRGWGIFGTQRTCASFSHKRPSDSLRRTYCGQSLSPQSQTGSEGPQKPGGTRLWKLRGRTDVGERHGARSLIARTPLSGLAASTIWSREDPLFSVHQVSDNTSTPQASTNVVLCWFLKGVVFLRDSLYCCTVLTHSFVSSFRIVLELQGQIEWHSKEICIS